MRRRLGLLGLLLLAGLGLKLATNPEPMGPLRADGNFYSHLARHVAEGDGLVTSVSLYHQGLRSLPRPSTIYPLWPLVLGNCARLVGLERAGSSIPELLYLIDLLLLYALANRLARSLGIEPHPIERFPALDIGHLAVLLFGMNPRFFAFTSLPYTEGLCFALIFSALLAASRAHGRWAAAWGAAAGALAGLAYLTRTQAVLLPLGLPLAFLAGASPFRRRLAISVASAVASAAVVAPWIVHLVAITDRFNPLILLDFSAYRETMELLPHAERVQTNSVAGFLWDRARGIPVSLDPWSRYSFVRSFGASVYLVPLVALALAHRCTRGFAEVRRLLGDEPAPILATLFAGLGGVVIVFANHTQYYPFEWWFHWRHGLPMFLLILPAMALGLRLGSRWRAIVLGAVLVSAIQLAPSLVREVRRRYPLPTAAQLQLIAWLHAQDPVPISASTHTHQLSILSRGLFHGMHCEDPPEQTRRIFAHLDVDYLIVFERDLRCRFLRGLDTEFEIVQLYGSGRERVMVLRPRREPEAQTP